MFKQERWGKEFTKAHGVSLSVFNDQRKNQGRLPYLDVS